MINDKTKLIIEHYIDKVKDFNIPEYQVLDWESEEAQKLRFSALINNFDMQNSTLLDVGCGLGHLAEYIDNQNLKLYYTGVDIIPEMINRANNKTFKNIIPQFMTIDFFKNSIEDDFDYIYTSGIFNLNLGNNEKFLEDAIKIFTLSARKGVCFNLLDESCREKYGNKYYYYNKNNILEKTNNILEKQNKKYTIKIVDEYLSNDFSVFIFF